MRKPCLSKHDLQQSDDQALDALDWERLRVLSLKLLADLKEAVDRLNQNPSNSSRPPSSQPPWLGSSASDSEEETDGENEGKDREEEREPEAPEHSDTQEGSDERDEEKHSNNKPRGKPGKPHGAPGHGRQVDLPVNRERLHRPDACHCCGERFPSDVASRAYTGRYDRATPLITVLDLEYVNNYRQGLATGENDRPTIP